MAFDAMESGWLLAAAACLGGCATMAFVAFLGQRRAGRMALLVLFVGLFGAAHLFATPGGYVRLRQAVSRIGDGDHTGTSRVRGPSAPADDASRRRAPEASMSWLSTKTRDAAGRAEVESDKVIRALVDADRVHADAAPVPPPLPHAVVVEPDRLVAEVHVERSHRNGLPAMVGAIVKHVLAAGVVAGFLFVGYVFLDSSTRGHFTWSLRLVSLLAFLGIYAMLMAFSAWQ